MNKLITPTWLIRDSLSVYFTRLGARPEFLQRLREMSDADVEQMNARVCAALSRINWDDPDE